MTNEMIIAKVRAAREAREAQDTKVNDILDGLLTPIDPTKNLLTQVISRQTTITCKLKRKDLSQEQRAALLLENKRLCEQKNKYWTHRRQYKKR